LVRDSHPRLRQLRKLERKKAVRAPYDRILIVTEGSKTEPLYFKEIRAAYRLNTANVEVLPSEVGTLPRQVVEYALDYFARNKDYDQIYTVFDRDEHRRYHEAFDLISSKAVNKLRNSAKQKVKITPVVSIPCFELWLLLHFQDVHHLMPRDDIFNYLKNHLPGYNKGQGGHYNLTVGNIGDAIRRSKRLSDGRNPRDDSQPYTNVYELIERLYAFAGKNI